MAEAAASPPASARSENPKRWWVVYPAYINSVKKVSEGRRIPKDVAVANPTLREIYEVCTFLKLKTEPEPDKAYSREPTVRSGRLRVLLKADDGAAVNAEVPNKRALLLALGKYIPKLKSRASAGSADGAGGGAGGGGGGKKGKKGRR